MNKKYEGSKADIKKDKETGLKEGSREDMAMDKAMETSHYKHAGQLGHTINKVFHNGKAKEN